MTRTLAVARLEWRLQMTSAPIWILLIVLLATTSSINPLAMIPGGAETIGGTRAVANSVYALTPAFAIGAFFAYPFFAALIAGLGIIRDDDVRIAELVRSTPLSVREDTWGRLLGIAATLSLAIGLHLLVMIAFRESGAGGVVLGPWSPFAYLVPVLVFVVPSVWWCAGIAFAVGSITRRAIAVYAIPVILSVLVFSLLWNWRPADIRPLIDVVLVVLDPTGLRWLSHHLFAVDRGFSHYNSAALAVDALLVANRLVTLALPAFAVVWASRRRAMVARDMRRSAGRDTAPDLPQASLGAAARSFAGITALGMAHTAPRALAGVLTVAWSELREVARQPSLYLFAALLFAIVPEIAAAEPDVYGGRTLLSAGDLAVRALPVVTVLVAMYLLALVTESMQRDRVTGFDAILHATPVATGALLTGRALAAVFVAGALALGCAAVTAAVALAQGGPTVRLSSLALVYGAVLLPTFVLWIAFVMLVSASTAQRGTAIALGIAALLLTAAQLISGSLTWLTNWPLWGALRWTDFGTFPVHGPALVANRLLALGLAACAFAATGLAFTRRVHDRAAARARRRPAMVLRRALTALPLAVLPVLTAGFLAIRIEAPRDTLASVATEARPVTIRAMDVTLRLDPEQQRLRVDGEYLLVNAGGADVRTLPMVLPPGVDLSTWSHDGLALTAGAEGLLLPRALAPRDSIRLRFRYTARVPAYASRNGGAVANYIHTSGALLSTHRGVLLPQFGRSAEAGFNGSRAFDLRLTVDVPTSFIVSAVGNLISETIADARRRSIWTSPVPLLAVTVAAAPYRVIREAGIAVYHHPDHAEPARAISTTLAAARRHYSAWFGELPWSELRVNEHAELFTQATAYPSAIALSETMGFKTARGARGDLSFAVTAHEAAHQWWGHLLHVSDGPGDGMLLEGMADFAALRLHAAVLGDSARMAFARELEREFLEGRRQSDEPSIATAREGTASHEAVLQKKGAMVLWMLQDAVGAVAMDRALRALVAAHPLTGAPATLEAFVAAVRTQATDTALVDRFVRQWIRSRALPAFSVESSRCTPAPAGWDCEAMVRNTGDAGATVEIAALCGDVRVWTDLRVSLDAGATRRIAFTSRERPDALVFDPDVRVLQAGRAVWGVTP